MVVETDFCVFVYKKEKKVLNFEQRAESEIICCEESQKCIKCTFFNLRNSIGKGFISFHVPYLPFYLTFAFLSSSLAFSQQHNIFKWHNKKSAAVHTQQGFAFIRNCNNFSFYCFIRMKNEESCRSVRFSSSHERIIIFFFRGLIFLQLKLLFFRAIVSALLWQYWAIEALTFEPFLMEREREKCGIKSSGIENFRHFNSS